MRPSGEPIKGFESVKSFKINKFFLIYKFDIEEGRNLNKKHFENSKDKIDNSTTIPVIMGHDYKEIYKLGDVFEVYVNKGEDI